MNKYLLHTFNPSVSIYWYADSEQEAKRQAEEQGHKIKKVVPAKKGK